MRQHLLRVERPASDFAELIAAARGEGLRVGWLEQPMRGAPVLRDLLREHFRGCTLVLVRGAVEAPLLEPRDGGFTVTGAEGERHLTGDQLAAALRRPRPW